MQRWRLLLICLCLGLVIICGWSALRSVIEPPTAFVPPDATDVQVYRISSLRYEVTYRAPRPLLDWRMPTIQRLTAEGWARGRLPDSNIFDRSLWFVRRRNLGFMGVIEQVSYQAGDGETPLVLLKYRRIITSPIVGEWLGR
jgi:hypothetical protein